MILCASLMRDLLMPELPEIETVLQGIMPHVQQQKIKKVLVRHRGLRWPVPHGVEKKLAGLKIQNITRRAKYLLFRFDEGTLIIHLGMSGSLRILTENSPIKKHDHIDIELANNKILRFNDPRRFGAFLWTESEIDAHPLLKKLGVEPFSKDFSGKYLWEKAQGKKIPIKTFIMDHHVVVGVGNIYASESLFLAKIHPTKKVNEISHEEFARLASAIKTILKKAIKQGGTTLKDFINSDGKPGYFTQFLQVYGRAGLACFNCNTEVKSAIIAQRNTFWCEECQVASS